MVSKKKIIATAWAAALAGGGFAIGGAIQNSSVPVQAGATEPGTASRASLPAFADLAERVSPAVVNIKVTAVARAGVQDDSFGEEFPFPGFRSPIPQQPRKFRREGSGSGFIIRKDGLILTNNHVVEKAQEITVTLSGKQQYKAKILGRDPKTDLAVIKIDPKAALITASLGNSDELRVGDWVMAIGNPFGLSNTVTSGIVSAKGRTIGAGPYDDFIQTDASINPGNSGGPLINAVGEVVGVNSAIFSQSGGNVGIGFAIPIDLAKKITDQLRKNGKVVRGWLGIRAQAVSQQAASSSGLSHFAGEIQTVTEVTENSPAAEAGIRVGDVIIEFNGKPLSKNPDLRTMIADTAPGHKITLKIVREKLERVASVRIGELPDDGDGSQQVEARDPELGLRVQRITPESSRRLGLSSIKGVLVLEVQSGSPAEQVGLEPADVIREVNQKPVNNVKDFERAVRQGRRGERILLLVQRGDNAVFFALKRKS